MARPAREPRVIPFAEIEAEFELAAYTLDDTLHPAVVRLDNGNYQIRVIKSVYVNGPSVSVTYDYLYAAADGTVTLAPRGYARQFRPGRIVGLDEAVTRYSRAEVQR